MAETRVAIVTGGARGLGAATAVRLARDGLKVGVVDLDDAQAKRTVDAVAETGGTAVAAEVDVSDPAAVKAAGERMEAELGPPTVLVNNAGITRDNLVFRITEEDGDAVIDVRLRGSFLMARAVQKHMVDAGWGRIVHLSSTAALGNRGQANYSTAKAGQQGFTKALAIELGRFGITVNCVAPGFIASDMTRATADRLSEDWDEYVTRRAAVIPVGRAGEPNDIAHAVAYSVVERSGFVSGQVLYVAGGPRA